MSEQYAMPKVSTIIRETGRLSNGAYYMPVTHSTSAKPSKLSKFRETMGGVFFYFFNIVSMAIMTMIFISSLALTFFVLDNTAHSSSVVTMHTQQIPSDGGGHYEDYFKAKELVKNVGK